jgi:adenylate cyclase
MGAIEGTTVNDPEDDYWRWASAAEASLLLGDLASTEHALAQATSVSSVGAALYAITRRQLSLVCSLTGCDQEILEMLPVPTVAHYCGHRDFADSAEGELESTESVFARSVVETLERHNIGIGYGSLAAGADIVIAEQLVNRGGELNVVLPFAIAEFEDCSVRPSGEKWVSRFRSLLEKATSVTLTCDSSYLGHDNLFAYASLVAMGHSHNRARVLTTSACQIAAWNRQPGPTGAGTSHDVRLWRRTGSPTHIIPLPQAATIKANKSPSEGSSPARVVRSVMFADFRGFSQLRDEHYATVIEQVFTPLAEAVQPYRSQLLFHKTWGDGIQLVFKTVAAAGLAAVAMQQRVNQLDIPSLHLPADMTLRVSAHVGPLFKLRDPFSHRLEWWGREMTRAARIEPRTPEGEVYVTDAFAALLALEPECELTTEYVGRVTTAKDFETIPMYRLCRRADLI